MNEHAQQLQTDITRYQAQFDQAQQELAIANRFLTTGSYANNQFVPIYKFASDRTKEYKSQIACLQSQVGIDNQSEINQLIKKLNKQKCTPINMANQYSHQARLNMKLARVQIAKCYAKLAKISL